MSPPDRTPQRRYDRQVAYAPFGPAGQRALAAARVAIVGAGGLGSALAESLARAGVGRLRLIDDDRVAWDNLHRQHLYTEADAAAGRPKVAAAAERLAAINADVRVEPVEARLVAANAGDLLDGADLVLDGTDNWAARFLLNDACIRDGRPWIYAGVVGGEAVTMSVLPGRTPCLRCVYDGPPPPCTEPTCRAVGVLGPAVHVIAGLQAFEAIKLLSGHPDALRATLLRMDLWTNDIRQLDLAAPLADCPCCRRRRFDFLEG
ncbi:MAG: HesA/MoeB/ThiF family protein [Planctomycetes bacterium]|nr:HesA/MoeB/ThiF family protein [Planctomycetota bacterium]